MLVQKDLHIVGTKDRNWTKRISIGLKNVPQVVFREDNDQLVN